MFIFYGFDYLSKTQLILQLNEMYQAFSNRSETWEGAPRTAAPESNSDATPGSSALCSLVRADSILWLQLKISSVHEA